MCPPNDPPSLDSLSEANRDRSHFSGHGRSRGSAGYVDPNDQDQNIDFLGRRGDTVSMTPPQGGFEEIQIAAAWDAQDMPDLSLLGRLMKKTKPFDIDLDLGILYEMKDGSRGAIQAFGEQFGNYEDFPYMALSGDERTGRTEGDDEYIRINGKKWEAVKRILIYVYIYHGALDWAQAKPQIHVRVPGQKQMIVSLSSHHKDLAICAIAGIDNVRNGLRITNYTEYFPGHAEMDRAFGYGLEWDNGVKAER